MFPGGYVYTDSTTSWCTGDVRSRQLNEFMFGRLLTFLFVIKMAEPILEFVQIHVAQSCQEFMGFHSKSGPRQFCEYSTKHSPTALNETLFTKVTTRLV